MSPSDHPSDPPSDRRRAPRLSAFLAAELKTPEGKSRSGISRDLSERGLLLLTNARLEPGDRVELRIFHPGSDEESTTVHGRVVRQDALDEYEATIWRLKVAVALDESIADLVQAAEARFGPLREA
ncbi:MAG TPA: PilZ domain-containing protein [Polyangiaceae bacterium]|nr:PilZ domain-containing protein [Polyangiaceae bacterium]